MKKIRLASFKSRLGSFIIDFLLITVCGILISLISFYPIFSSSFKFNESKEEIINERIASHLYKDVDGVPYTLDFPDFKHDQYYYFEESIQYYYLTYLPTKGYNYDIYWYNVYILHLNDIGNKYDNEPTYEDTLFKWTDNHNEIGVIKDDSKYPVDPSSEHYVDDADKTLYKYFFNQYDIALDNIESQSFVGGKYQNIVLLTLSAFGLGILSSSLVVSLLFPMVTNNFKTPGKMITKLVVLTDDGYKYKKSSYIFRYLFLLVVEIVGGILTIGGMLLISYTVILCSKKRRCLHDLACSSVVADERHSIFFADKKTEEAFKAIKEKDKPKKVIEKEVDDLVLDLDKIKELRKGMDDKNEEDSK